VRAACALKRALSLSSHPNNGDNCNEVERHCGKKGTPRVEGGGANKWQMHGAPLTASPISRRVLIEEHPLFDHPSLFSFPLSFCQKFNLANFHCAILALVVFEYNEFL